MWKAFKHFLYLWLRPVYDAQLKNAIDLGQSRLNDIKSRENEIKLLEKQLKDVKTDLAMLEEDKNKLIDQLLHLSGLDMLHTQAQEGPRTGPRRRVDVLTGVSQGRDFSRLATQLENQAFADDEFTR